MGNQELAELTEELRWIKLLLERVQERRQRHLLQRRAWELMDKVFARSQS